MRYIFTTILLFITVFGIVGQNQVERYAYWFNGEHQATVIQNVTPGGAVFHLDTQVPVNHLPQGLHAFHIRFQDNEKQWSSTLSRFFYKMPVASHTDNSIQSYQYWFNNDFENAVVQNAGGTKTIGLNDEVNVSALPDGLHAFHIRFRDANDQWSNTLSRFFYKMPVKAHADNSIQEYQFWFNNDMENAVTETGSGTALLNLNSAVDASELPNGLQAFHIRFRDQNGLWSTTLSSFFYKMPAKEVTQNLVTGYQYWFDDNEENLFGETLNEPVNPLQLMAEIETPYLDMGEHTLNIRFLDLQHQWSVVMTDTFMVENCAPRPLNNLTGESNPCQGATSVFAVETALNINSNEWSVSPAEAATITNNHDRASFEWGADFTGEAVVSVYGVNPCGVTEAKNITVTILPSPQVTAMDDLTVCEGEQVELTIQSSEGVTEWNVEELNFAALSTETYTVTATNACGSVSDEVTITVNPYPTLNIMSDVEICSGTTVELAAESNEDVAWDSGTTSVTPLETTVYTATATLNNCQVTESVTINVHPVYEFIEEDQICSGDSYLWHEAEYTEAGQYIENYPTENGCDSTFILNLSTVSIDASVSHDGTTLTAGEANATYQWVDCENSYAAIENATNQVFEAETSGNYAVLITLEDCSETSDCYQVVVNNIGEREEHPQITAFPNPARKELHISLGSYMEGFSITLYDASGHQVHDRKVISGTEVSINVSNLKNGTYILEILWNDKKWHRKIVVQD